MQYLRPSFFIIGERKCGTSSLYRYLIDHPNVLPCALKEPNFFGKGAEYVHQNIDDYWALFPQKEGLDAIEFEWPELNKEGVLYHEPVVVNREENKKYITGEASANTFYEVNPQLVHQYLPNIKLIILFRNPVDRAFSHHRMYQRFQEEGRDLGFKVNDFETDALAEIAQIKQGKKGEFLSPSIYINQLKKWTAVFGKEQIRIYFLEDLADKQKGLVIMEDLQYYLDLPFIDYSTILEKRFNVAPKAAISPELFNKLSAFFEPYNFITR